MHTRESFHLGLSNLKDSIVSLGRQVDQTFNEAMQAFITKNENKFEEIKAYDVKINQQEISINENATLLIARQQPVASDLRKIIVAFKVSSDLERVGDLAVDICKAAQRIPITKFKIDTAPLVKMATITSEMLAKSLTAYEKGNVLEAQQIALLDDQVDEMYSSFIKEIFNIFLTEKIEIEQVTQLAFIARYIERIADHATNIAELIIYEVNGKYFDLN